MSEAALTKDTTVARAAAVTATWRHELPHVGRRYLKARHGSVGCRLARRNRLFEIGVSALPEPFHLPPRGRPAPGFSHAQQVPRWP